jgi:hypothetical protein
MSSNNYWDTVSTLRQVRGIESQSTDGLAQ